MTPEDLHYVAGVEEEVHDAVVEDDDDLEEEDEEDDLHGLVLHLDPLKQKKCFKIIVICLQYLKLQHPIAVCVYAFPQQKF